MEFRSLRESVPWVGGYFCSRGNVSLVDGKVLIEVNSDDKECIENFRNIVQRGSIHECSYRGWQWRADTWEDTLLVYALLEPWLHGIFYQRWVEALLGMKVQDDV